MTVRRAMAVLVLAAPLLAATKAPVPPFVVMVTSGGQPHIPVHIKDSDLDIRLALSFDSAMIVNSTPAQRAGLKPFPLIGKRTFKSAMVPGGEAIFRGNLYGVTPRGLAKSTLPVIWVDKIIAADADGVLPVSALKADQVVFELSPQASGARIYTITRKGSGVMMKTKIGDETINVAFELNSPDTVMNARAAAALDNAGLVKRAGEIGFWQPFPGVALPFERMVPAAGAAVLGLPLFRPAVRVTEAQAKTIDARTKAGTSSVDDDEDAITVTASRKKGRDPWILIGRDVLRHCSRIVFDRPGKAWVLTCAF